MPHEPGPITRGTDAARCVSIDVEEYFQIEAAYGAVGPGRWGDWPTRVERSMDRLLELFDRTGVKATLFFLGSVAKSHPGLAPRCAGLGHEIASHGSMHDRLHRLSPESMLRDVRESKQLLEDQTGRAVLGYRAPTWSVTRRTDWAIDVLAEAGFRYDASVFPVHHPSYGIPDAPDRPYFIRSSRDGARLLETPPLVWRVGGRNLAVAGGGYFRLLPLALMKRGLRQARAEGRPAILYFHPWEFDPDLPKMPLSAVGRLRTYTGLKSALRRLEQVIRAFDHWSPIAANLDRFEQSAAGGDVFTLRRPAAA